MRRTFTQKAITVYWLWLAVFLLPFFTDAHNLTRKNIDDDNLHKEQPKVEQPNFLTPGLFIFGKTRNINPPFKVEESIVTWQDAITKGLPILKVGKQAISYNDYTKGDWKDSIKVDEGTVDCIRYKISKNTDSIKVGEEFELTVVAEYIDGIPYTMINKECADFCIKVFMPEGFVPTGGNYYDFEGFSFRPDGLRRIERKIKGYFTTQPENPCFLLTKGAKFYDPQYLLEIKQNYCLAFTQKTSENLAAKPKVIKKESANDFEKSLVESTKENTLASVNAASCPTGWSWKNEKRELIVNPNNTVTLLGYITFCYKTLSIDCDGSVNFNVKLVFSDPVNSNIFKITNTANLKIMWHGRNDNCCFDKDSQGNEFPGNLMYPFKNKDDNYLEFEGKILNQYKKTGLQHFDNLCGLDSQLDRGACAWGNFDEDLDVINAPAFSNGVCNQTLTATCETNQKVVWVLPSGIPESTTNISTLNATSQTYKAKCKNSCGSLSNEASTVNIVGSMTPDDISEGFSCNTRTASSYCPCGEIRWFYPGSTEASNFGKTTINITSAGTYKVKCGDTGNLKSKDFGQYSAWGGSISEPSCGNPITGYVYNSVDASLFPKVIVTLTKGTESFSKEYQTTAGYVSNYRYFSMPYNDFSAFLAGKNGTIEITIEVKASSCNVPVGTPRDLCCTAGTINVTNNGPLPVGGNLTMKVTSSDMNLSNSTITWTGPASFSASGNPATRNAVTSAHAGTYNANVSVSSCPAVSGSTVVSIYNCPASASITSNNSTSDITAVLGQYIILKANINISVPANELSFQWKKNGEVIGGINSDTYEIISFSSNDQGTYSVTITRLNCAPVEDEIKIKFGTCPSVNILANGEDKTSKVFTGTPIALQAVLSVSPVPGGTTYQWLKNDSPINGATTANYTVTSAGKYKVVVNVGGGLCSSAIQDEILIFPYECLTSITDLKVNNEVFGSYKPNLYETVVLSASVSDPSNVNYQWYKDNSLISGATSSTYTITNYTSANAGRYSLTITKIGFPGCTDTKSVSLEDPICPVLYADAWINIVNYQRKTVYAKVGDRLDYGASISGATSYNWTTPQGTHIFRSSAKENLTMSDAGRYTVVVVIGGCTLTDYFDLEIKCFDPVAGKATILNSGIDVGRNPIVNAGDNITFTISEEPGATYCWHGPAFNNGGPNCIREANFPYARQDMTGSYTVEVMKNGCTQIDQVYLEVGCAALNNVKAYSNSPNCEVKTGETLHLWVDKEGPGYTYDWGGPNNFDSKQRATGVSPVTDAYSGNYSVLVGYAGCTQTVTPQVNVCIFKCDLGFTVEAIKDSCNVNTGTGSIKVTATSNTTARTLFYRIEIRKTNAQGAYYYEEVTGYSGWRQTTANSYTFNKVLSGVYRVFVKEQNLSEQGGLGRICEAPFQNFELKCDPCSYTRIDASPSTVLVPAATISPITLTLTPFTEVGAPITVNSLSGYSWSGPNGKTGNTNSISVRIPGTYFATFTATYNTNKTKSCTNNKTVTMPLCPTPGISVTGYKTTCESGVNYVYLTTEGDFGNLEFSSDLNSWFPTPKVQLSGATNVDYKIYARSKNIQTCIFELITITKTCDCVGITASLAAPKIDCSLTGNTLKAEANFGAGNSIEFKIKKDDGSFESAWAAGETATIRTFTNVPAGKYYIFARKSGTTACYIQTFIEVQDKEPESPVSYPCDINKYISIGETSSVLGVKTQKSWSGNALKLDGIKDYGTTPDLTEFGGTAFTFEAWALPDADATIRLYEPAEIATNPAPLNQRALAQGKIGGTRTTVTVAVGSNGVNLIEETSTIKRVIFSKPVNINNWVHVAVTYQSNAYNVFINGAKFGPIATTNTSGGAEPPKVIGGSGDTYFKGKVDEARWWNTAKTEADIKAKMSMVLVAPFPADLKRYYRFDQVSGQTVPNAVAPGTNNMTLFNGECNAFIDNTIAASSLELYPQFSWSNGGTGKEITIPTPAVTTCFTVTMVSPTGATCTGQVCIPIENCNDITVTVTPTVTPAATYKENTGVRPLLSANITNNSVKPTVTVAFETSMSMAGNDIINVGDYRYQTNTMTYEFWAKPTTATTEVTNFTDPTASSNRHIIRPGYTTDGAKAGFGLTLGANGLVLYENGPGYMTTRLKYLASFSNWTHIAVVYEEGKPRVYVNGEQVYSSNTPSARQIVGITEMGWNNNTGFQGLIDELRIWDNARSGEEIKDNFNRVVVATYPNIGYWRFNRSSGKVLDTPTKIAKDESSHLRTLQLNTATVSTGSSSGTIVMNPKITWWLEKTDPDTGEIIEEQVGVGNEYQMPLEMVKLGTYNYTVKFVKNNNTICKRTKTVTITANTEPVTCFTILSDENRNLISGNLGSNLVQTMQGITTDRIWKRTYRSSDQSYFVFSAFNGMAWQNNTPANNVTLVSGDPTNANHRWRFDELGGGRYKVSSLANSDHVLYMADGGGDLGAIISGFPWWNGSQYSFKVELVTCPVIDDTENCVAEGRISYQKWTNVTGGGAISLLTNRIATQPVPNYEDYITSLEKTDSGTDNFGARIRGYICPPVTGYYTFWVAGDNSVELWLSTDDKVTGRQKIAYHTDYSGLREYEKYGSQRSSLIPLTKGKKYYIEVLHKEDTGGDGVSVRWQTPYTEIMEPIPGQYLAPYEDCAIKVTVDPEEEEIAVDTKINMQVFKPEGVTIDKIYKWTVHQGGEAANLIDVDGNSVTSIIGYKAWAKPNDEAEMVYKVEDMDDPQCYKFIKKKVKLVVCACTVCGDNGDGIKNADPEVTNDFAFTGQNYVVENVHLDGAPGGKVMQSISYFDGLGRPSLKVNTKSSVSAGVVQDVYVPITYDQFGRESLKHLHNFTSSVDGKITAGGSRGATSITFEASPLNRVISQTAPGEPNSVTTDYKANSDSEVKKLNILGNVVTVSGSYSANKLYKTETTNEKGLVIIEYKDISNQLICKKTGSLTTYYVYDDLGLLRCVIPPKADNLLAGASFNIFSQNLVFAYEYNNRGLLIKKKVPDATAEEMIYDEYDRLRCTKLSNGTWTYVKYDAINRLIETGTCTNCSANLSQVVTLVGDIYMAKTTYDAYPADPDKVPYSVQNNFPSTSNSAYLKGLVTHTVTKVLEPKAGMRSEIKTSIYYDNYGRTIQVASETHLLSSYSYDLKKLDFVGRVIRSKQIVHNGESIKIDQTFSYERGGKVKSICQKVDDGTKTVWEPVGTYYYNGLGEMEKKELGCKLQTVTYNYDLRGRLKKMNDPYTLESKKSFFGFILGYDAAGNISQQVWQVADRIGKDTDPFKVKRDKIYTDTYEYDALNRIKNSTLVDEPGGTPFKLENMTYDPNGNILTLKRTFNGEVKDNMVYEYIDNSNKLLSVNESQPNISYHPGEEFFSENSSIATEYEYDAAGNMTKDYNKGTGNGNFMALSYNYLNLIKSAKSSTYTYTATGQKVQAETPLGTFNYIGGVVYKNSAVEFVATPEGRVLPKNTVKQNRSKPYVAGDTLNKFWRYEYDLKDHLGNLRVACRCTEVKDATKPGQGNPPIIVQQVHYDPWGVRLPFWGSDPNNDKYKGKPEDRFKYNSKESQEDISLIDFGARMYDPAIGRWSAIDRLAEKSRRWSTYNYVFNNPLKFIDPDGLDPYLIFDNKTGTLRIYDDNGTTNNYKDDKLLGTYKAHNNVAKSSRGKWEDGVYKMVDKNSRHKHPGKMEKDGETPVDSKDGGYGEGGIYRAGNFKETTGDKIERGGMAVHAGREYKDFDKRITMGCVRTTPEAMAAIDNAIATNGPLQSIIIQNNRESTNSDVTNKIDPGKGTKQSLFTVIGYTPMPADATKVSSPLIFHPFSPKKEND